MLDWTDRHCRFLHRLFGPETLLYTEMVHVNAVLKGDRARHLAHAPEEHPVALQLGGNEPEALAEACRVAEAWGFDEINLNVGCPSDRVQAGAFGACLMAEPALVARCIEAMARATHRPVTVKCRLGITRPARDGAPALDLDHDDHLHGFVRGLVSAGVAGVIVHARKAVLGGLSPKDNRTIPPLQYERVYALKRAFPTLPVSLNGGLGTVDACEAALAQCDGVMIGRAAYHDPCLLGALHERFSPQQAAAPTLSSVIAAYAAYAEEQFRAGVPLPVLTRPLLGLVQGRPGARRFRRLLSEDARNPEANPGLLTEALALVQEAA
jgi:tRNA-dihydrouridine synthase A